MYCYYDEPEPDDDTWWMEDPKDFSACDAQDVTCKSCGEKIEKGATCLKFDRWRWPTAEESEQGAVWKKIPLDPYYHCEECGEIYLNLTASGDWRVDICNDMHWELEEYWEMTGFDPKKWSGHFQNGITTGGNK